MKKLLLLLIIPFLSFGQDLTYVPDDAFEEYIETYIPGASNGNINDNYVNTSALNGCESAWSSFNVLLDQANSLNLSSDFVNGEITDLTGIEDFVGIRYLIISDQLVTSLDLANVDFAGDFCPGGTALYAGLNINNNPYLTEIILPQDTLHGFSCSNNIYLECISFDNVTVGNDGVFNGFNISGPSLSNLDFSQVNEIMSGASLALGYINIASVNQINLQHPDYIWWENVTIYGNPNCIQVDDVFYAENMWSYYDYETFLPVEDPNISMSCYIADDCEFQVEGNCTDESACNYGEEEDCIYPFSNCAITLFNDSINMWVTSGGFYNQFCECVQNECEDDGCAGCMDEIACNYNPYASVNDDSCEYPYDQCEVIYFTPSTPIIEYGNLNDECECSPSIGCIDEAACNYGEEEDCIYPFSNCVTTFFDPATNNFVTTDGFYNQFCECVQEELCDIQFTMTALLECPPNLSTLGIDGLTAYGGTPPYNYTWEFDGEIIVDGPSETFIMVEFAEPGSTDIYTLTVTDANNCELSSIYPIYNYMCTGCTDIEACNYNEFADVDDGSCFYVQEYYDCDGNCLVDFDEDGICDELEVEGCTQNMACNYNSNATEDDGSCDYSCYCDTIYVDNFITDTIVETEFIELTDTLYIDNFITDTIVEIVYENYYIYDTIVVTEYVEVIITEYIDCDTGLPCTSGMGEIIDKSKTDGRLYNLLGQEILRREGIYIEGGEVKYRFQ